MESRLKLRRHRITSEIFVGAAVGAIGGIIIMELMHKIMYPHGKPAEYVSASSDTNLKRRAEELYQWLQAGQALLIEIE